MNYYFAPMEGIGGYIYRNAQAKYFKPCDKYFAPFISPTYDTILKKREKEDIDPENNKGMNLVPQILTNKSEYFLKTAKVLSDLGYREVNLNLGCPSRTVVTKGKGAGFLDHLEALDLFLEEIFEGRDRANQTYQISVKTRIGMYEEGEAARIFPILWKYPIAELTIHPRLQVDYYKGFARIEVFEEIRKGATCPLVYNGDLDTLDKIRSFQAGHTGLAALMMGRGFYRNPGLLQEELEKKVLYEFIKELEENYSKVLCGDKTVLFKLKEIWSYLMDQFPGQDKLFKKIRKSQNLAQYDGLVEELFWS